MSLCKLRITQNTVCNSFQMKKNWVFAQILFCDERGIRKSEFKTKTQFLSICVKCNLVKLMILIFFFFPKNRVKLLPINQYCNIVLNNFSSAKTNKNKYLVEVYYTTKRPKNLSLCHKLRFLIRVFWQPDVANLWFC